MKKVYNYIPLCWITNTQLLICTRRLQIRVHDLINDSFDTVGTLPVSGRERLFMRFSLSARAMRLINFTCCQLDEERVLVAYRSIVYLVEVQAKAIRKAFSIDKGKRPLFFCRVMSVGNRFESGIYYGDYCGNSNKNPINLYHVNPFSFEKRIVYTFEKGMINHVHNVVYDEGRDCMWVFTGDFGDAASIWRSADGFRTMECVLKGSQDYRADVVTVYDGNLWYATDAPFAPNHLMMLHETIHGWEIKREAALNGPVIYGGRMGDYLVFSTDVESDGIYKNRFDTLTSRKLGKGIKDYYAYLYTMNLKTNELRMIYRCKKDFLPFVVFQFGAIMFPHGECDGGVIPAFHVALNRHQLRTLMIKNNGDSH